MRIKTTVIAGIFLLAAGLVFSQDDGGSAGGLAGDSAGTVTGTETGAPAAIQPLQPPGSIPAELLRPRREESPRYPVDTVIGPMGQGQAPKEAYDCARKAAAALLAGTPGAAVLSTVNSVFVESCINALNTITPRLFRLGGGREEPDGSVSFLVRFAGREQAITGELFVRFEEPPPPEPPPPPPAAETGETVTEGEAPSLEPAAASVEAVTEGEAPSPAPPPAEAPAAETAEPAAVPEETPAAISAPASVPAAAVPPPVPAVKTWIFEDLILEEAQDRAAEAGDSVQRFDFSPYERLY